VTTTQGAVDAATALTMVGADPGAALEAADRIVSAVPRPRTAEQVAEVATAHRAAGLALRALSDPEAAEKRIRRGLRLAERAGLADVAAEIRMSLAYVLLEFGRTRAALAATDHALGVLTGLKAARVRVIRALVLERSGKTREALADYAAAWKVIHRAGDGQWEARLRHNRALMLMMQGETAAALSDLSWSREYDLARGNVLDAADALCNMGVALGEAGDIPGALELFDRADDEWGEFERPERWLCRADVLSMAGLADEAAAQARSAVAWLTDRRWESLEAEARVGLALALLAGPSPDLLEVAAEAQRARAMFARHGKTWWEQLANYAATKAVLMDHATTRDLDRTVDAASALAEVGHHEHAADLRIAAGRAALARGDERRARTLLGPLAASIRAGDLDVRTRAWVARALLAELDGRAGSAVTSLRRAWDVVETQRSLVGATELRAGAAAHATALVADGSRLAISTGSVGAAFDWAELGRAAVLRYRPATAPRDPDLARALTRLRSAVRAEDDARMEGGSGRQAESARRHAEAAVVRLTRQRPGTAPGLRPVALSDVRDRLNGTTFVQLLVEDDEVWAVTLNERASALTRLSALSDVTRWLGTLSFGLSRVLTGFGTEAGRASAWAAATGAAGRLDSALLVPILRFAQDDELVLCPAGPLTGLPWSLLGHAHDRVVSIAPSATVWCQIRDRSTSRDLRVLAVAGPGLPGATSEVAGVVRQHRSAVSLTGADAQVSRVLDEAAGASVLHLAAHGHLRKDNPLFSAVDLADGQLTGYDLESLDSVPETVVLSACSAGAGHAAIGDETLGLAWTLMGMGTSSVVAALFAVPDEPTRELMVSLHELIAAGHSPAAALASVRCRVAADPAVTAVAGAFVAYGA
jgi:tetratricopeptide (TPR) repeat protein